MITQFVSYCQHQGFDFFAASPQFVQVQPTFSQESHAFGLISPDRLAQSQCWCERVSPGGTRQAGTAASSDQALTPTAVTCSRSALPGALFRSGSRPVFVSRR